MASLPTSPTCTYTTYSYTTLRHLTETTSKPVRKPPKTISYEWFMQHLPKPKKNQTLHKATLLPFFCPSQHQSLSRDRLYSHLAQYMKQGQCLEAAAHMVDKEGYSAFTKMMGWLSPPLLNLPTPNRNHHLKPPSTRSQPYRISRQKPTALAVPRMTRRHTATFEESLPAIERETKRIRELFHELWEHLPESARIGTIVSMRVLSKCTHSPVICRDIVSGTP